MWRGGWWGSNRVYYRGFENREFRVKIFEITQKECCIRQAIALWSNPYSHRYYCIPKMTWGSLIFEVGIISGIVHIIQSLWVLHNSTENYRFLIDRVTQWVVVFSLKLCIKKVWYILVHISHIQGVINHFSHQDIFFLAFLVISNFHGLGAGDY